MHVTRPRWAASAHPLWAATFAALVLAIAPEAARAQTPAKLLLQSVCVLGSPGEYVAVYNPTGQAVDLSNYYLTDALFTNQSYGFLPDPANRTPEKSGGGTFFDLHVRFPAGAMIASHDTVVVAIAGATGYAGVYARKPHFEVVAGPTVDDAAVPNMREAFSGSIAGDRSLSNAGESVTLYFWDQASDKVVDIDYVVWGTDGGQFRYFNNKDGISVDGPDGDTMASFYEPDTAPSLQNPVTQSGDAHSFGNALRREDYNEGTQTIGVGNGIDRRNETSENLATTWSTGNLAAPPFVKGSLPAVLTARAGGPYSGTVNTAITFNGSGSTPAEGATITTYSWQFGDNGIGTGSNPTHTYTTAGTFTVTLTVTGSGGGTASSTTTATVTGGEPPPPSSAVKLLLASVCVLGTPNEYVAVYNPSNEAVNLSNYYLSDALFTNQSYAFLPDPANRTPEKSGGGTFFDFHVRFPDGAMIASHDTVVVAIAGSTAYAGVYARKPHFEVVAGPTVDDASVPNMREAFSGSIAPDRSMSNAGESVTLYYWDQTTDLVTDVDYLVWGTDGGQFRYFNVKTGFTVDGPDAGTTTSAYLADTPASGQNPVTESGDAHSFGNAMRREDYNEGSQRTTAGNGVGGRDETSENLRTTWSTSNLAAPPFVKGSSPAVLTARAGGPYSGTVNTAITFNGSGSTPAAGGTITTYSWQFGDNGIGTGSNPTHTYTTAGTFTVTLTVTGSGGGTASSSTTATVTGGEPPPPSSAVKLLLASVCVLGTPNEYVAVYNPSNEAVNLSNYYLSDALFTNQSYAFLPDPANRTPEKSGGGTFFDFHVRFPDGAMIASHDTVVVAIAGATAYAGVYARKPHFEVVAGPTVDDSSVPNMREAFSGSIAPDRSMSNAGESVTLYYWDQTTDLVTDVDYLVWGTDGGQFRYFNVKTGFTVDGPDAGTTTSAYLADTPASGQNPVTESGDAHGFGNAMRREDYNEGSQRTTGGNGVGGRDETSENLRTTWSTSNLAAPPFVKGSAPAQLTARPGGPYSGTVNTAITFNGSQSTPAAGGSITAYNWTFGDNGTGTGANPQHTYTTAGTFTVTLTVTGSVGGTASATTTATVTTGEPPPPSTAVKLVIQSVCVLGTPNEFVTVFNPSNSAVDLSNYYITDALFPNQTYAFFPNPTNRTPEKSGGGTFFDFHVRFPAGATIAAHDTVAVAVAGSTTYSGVYSRKPHFEVVAGPTVDDASVPNMREAFPGSIAADRSLSNAGESVTLYYYDQTSDLVVDIDYVVWGTDGGQFRYFNNKTGITVDGPDGDATTSAYKADTTPASQNPITESGDAHGFGNAMRREDFNEGTQKTTGGNGVGGRDETSENLRTTWSTTNAAAPPFVKGNAPPPPGNLTAFISGTPLRGAVGQAINFNGSQSTPATGQTITTYAWNFGDGGTATGAIASHAYTANGNYTASLTVTGSGGGTNTATTVVSITVPSEGALQLTARTFMPTIGETYPITLDVPAGLTQFLRIYDLEGREVRVLLDQPSVGKKTYIWDGRDEELMLVSAGTYIVHLETRDDAGHIQTFSGPVVVARRLERN